MPSLLNSSETVTRLELRNPNIQTLLQDICTALLSTGWTELPRQHAWQQMIISANPLNGEYCGSNRATVFTFKTSPSAPYDVLIGANPGETVANLGARMLAVGAISAYSTKYEAYSTHGNAMSGFLRMWKDPGSDYSLLNSSEQYPFIQATGYSNVNTNYHRLYRTGGSLGYMEESWMWGYRKFLSKMTPQGHQVILYVGWQTDVNEAIVPCFHMRSATEPQLDVNPPSEPGETGYTTPTWNPSINFSTSRSYEIVCNPYQFIVYQPQFTDTRSFVMGSCLRMNEANVHHTVDTVEDIGYYTRIRTSFPHFLSVGDIVTLRGVTSSDGGPNISDTPFAVMNVINEYEIHLNVDTRGYTYSSGEMGDNEHPFNAFFLLSSEGASSFPRNSYFVNNNTAAIYFWHLSGWKAGTTGSSGQFNNNNAGLRVPLRTQRMWPGSRGIIYAPLVGWGDSLTDNNNYWRGYLWDAMMTNRSHVMDRYEELHDGENWYQFANISQSYSFWMRTT